MYFLAILMIGYGTVAPYLQYHVNADVAWLLHSTSRMIDGAVLYRDIIETTPPLICLLTWPWVALARALQISPTGVFYFFVVAVNLASLMLCARVSAETLFHNRPFSRHTLLLSATFFLFVFPVFLFGQKEQLTLALVLPYLLSAARRVSANPIGPRFGVLLGLMAGIGIALKPFFVIPWLAVEIYVLLWTRRPREMLCAENVMIAAIQVGYIGLVLVAFPTYVQETLPLLLHLFNAHNVPLVVLAFRGMLGGLIICLPLAFAFNRDTLSPPVRWTLLIAAGAFLVVFLVQQKGWEYHLLPSLALSMTLALTLLVAVLEAPSPEGRRTHLTRWLASALLVVCIAYPVALMAGPPLFPRTFFLRVDKPGYQDVLHSLIALVQKHAPGEAIFVLSASTWPGYHLLSWERAIWPYRFPSLWPVPGLYRQSAASADAPRNHPFDEMPVAERYVFDAIVNDLTSTPPRLMIVDAGHPKHGWIHEFGDRQFDYIEYFQRDLRFARMLDDYEMLPSVGRYQIFKLREADSSGAFAPGHRSRRT